MESEIDHTISAAVKHTDGSEHTLEDLQIFSKRKKNVKKKVLIDSAWSAGQVIQVLRHLSQSQSLVSVLMAVFAIICIEMGGACVCMRNNTLVWKHGFI